MPCAHLPWQVQSAPGSWLGSSFQQMVHAATWVGPKQLPPGEHALCIQAHIYVGNTAHAQVHRHRYTQGHTDTRPSREHTTDTRTYRHTHTRHRHAYSGNTPHTFACKHANTPPPHQGHLPRPHRHKERHNKPQGCIPHEHADSDTLPQNECVHTLQEQATHRDTHMHTARTLNWTEKPAPGGRGSPARATRPQTHFAVESREQTLGNALQPTKGPCDPHMGTDVDAHGPTPPH